MILDLYHMTDHRDASELLRIHESGQVGIHMGNLVLQTILNCWSMVKWHYYKYDGQGNGQITQMGSYGKNLL